MANDNKASFAVIGLTVILAVTAIIGTLIYLGGLGDTRRKILVETYYDKAVSGLSVGSVVNMRGVKIGEVSEISFIGVKYPSVQEVDAVRIYIRMAIDPKLCGFNGSTEEIDDVALRQQWKAYVDRGLRATVSSSGITGISRIEINFYPPESLTSTTKIAWEPQNLFIPPQVSLLDNFSDSATKVMNQINRMDLNAAWSNIANSVESLSRATDMARQMMENRQGDVDKVFEDFSEAMRTIKELAAELKRNPSLLIRENRRTSLPETER